MWKSIYPGKAQRSKTSKKLYFFILCLIAGLGFGYSIHIGILALLQTTTAAEYERTDPDVYHPHTASWLWTLFIIVAFYFYWILASSKDITPPITADHPK
jgi:hypothetical protein